MTAESRLVLRRALTSLSEDQQQVLALRFGCGLGIGDVAQTMDTTEGLARQIEVGAVTRLAYQLAQEPTAGR